MNSKPPEASSISFTHVLLFVSWLIILNLWANYHLGAGFGNPGLLAALTAAFTAGLGSLEKLLGENAPETIKKRLLECSRLLLATPVLAVLYLVAIIVMSSYASIRVTAAKEVAGKKVQVWAIKEAGAEGKDAAKAALVDKKVPADGGTVRKMVFTSPFGRVYRLKVEGYVGTTVKVYPFAGKQVVPEKDLRPSPSVLFRPPPGILSKSFEVKVGNKVALTLPKYGGKAMLLGSEHKVPSSLLADWNLELDLLLAEYEFSQNQEDKIAARQLRVKSLLEWKRHEFSTSNFELEPGMKIIAEIKNRRGKVIARGEVLLTKDPLLDVLMYELDE